MKDSLRFLVINDSSPDSFQANRVQSNNWSGALSQLCDVIYVQRSSKNEINQHTHSIKSSPGILGRLLFIVRVAKRYPASNFDYVYLRSPFMLLAYYRNIIYEFHESVYYRASRIINYFFKKIIEYFQEKKRIKLSVYISSELRKILSHNSNFIILNDASSWSPAKKINKKSEEFVISYVGSLKRDRKTVRILSLAKHFPNFTFMVAGGGEDEGVFMKSNLPNIKFLGVLDQYQLKDIVNKTNIFLGIWSYDVETIDYCSPLKLYDYAKSGRPFIIESYPVFKNLEFNYDPIWCEPEDLNSLIESIKYTHENYDNFSGSFWRSSLNFKDSHTWISRAKELLNKVD